jgi:hypothetical protein
MRSRLTGSIASPVQWEIDALVSFLQSKTKLLVITGAGISTASGLPDYRFVAYHTPISRKMDCLWQRPKREL